MSIMTATARQPASAVERQVWIAGDEELATQAKRVLAARGLVLSQRQDAVDHVMAWSTCRPLDGATAVELAAQCAKAAAQGVPAVILAPAALSTSSPRVAMEQSAALAFVRAHAAVLTSDPDVWLEAIVMVARWPLPRGSRVALVAEPGTWLAAQAAVMAESSSVLPRIWSALTAPRADIGADKRRLGGEADHGADKRRLGSEADHGADKRRLGSEADHDEPTDIVLYDCEGGQPDAQLQASIGALWVAVSAKSELQSDLRASHRGALVGARTALTAATLVGAAVERMVAGLGPAGADATGDFDIDRERITRQFERVNENDQRIGDHETKVMLASYGVPITRQAVATTASAALRIAKRAGFPVELKPWGPDVKSEADGCPVETNVTTGADVRRAFSAVLTASGLSAEEEDGAAVIVREAPPRGRELAASVVNLPSVGWTVVVRGTGHSVPLAAPAPLRMIDANAIAGQLLASRSSEHEPDRAGLAALLRKASHLVIDHQQRIGRLDLSRIVVGARGERTVVVDASIELNHD
jgi:hypothetical protein